MDVLAKDRPIIGHENFELFRFGDFTIKPEVQRMADILSMYSSFTEADDYASDLAKADHYAFDLAKADDYAFDLAKADHYVVYVSFESSGSGGRAGGERNGGGGNGNQGIGGGVGGGGQREGIGNEWRGNRGRNHGGGYGNGDDDGNDRGGWLGYIEGERGPMGPGPHRLAEMLLFLNAEMIGTLESLDIHGLPARARIFRVVSLGFNSVAVVCLSASIGQRRTNPRLATILSWIGSFATLLGFISMIAMAFSASFIP